MDFANLSDRDIENLLRGRTDEESILARRLLERRRARERQQSGWKSGQSKSTTLHAQGSASARSVWTHPADEYWYQTHRHTVFDRRVLAEMATKHGWSDMPTEKDGDVLLLIWVIARGINQRALAG